MTRPDATASVRLSGPLRIEPSMTVLTRRLRAGDIAVIDALDLDQRAAEALAAARPAAVVNVTTSISGRFPAGGARVLLDAGIPLLDDVGGRVLACADAAAATIVDDVLSVDGEEVARGHLVTQESLAHLTAGATEGMRVQLATFTANAMDHVERESGPLLDGTGLPDVDLDLAGRHVVVIAPGYRHREQLRQIRRYLRDRRPVIIAVGEAADAALELASAPHLVLGDVDGAGDHALKAADRIVLHDAHGGPAGQARVDALGLEHGHADSQLPSAALAILLAHARGAEVIVTVGVEATLQDYLEAAHADGAGLFLARLQAGRALVDAPALAQVYRHRYSLGTLVALVASALVVMAAALWATPAGRAWVEDVGATIAGWFGGAG